MKRGVAGGALEARHHSSEAAAERNTVGGSAVSSPHGGDLLDPAPAVQMGPQAELAGVAPATAATEPPDSDGVLAPAEHCWRPLVPPKTRALAEGRV